MEETVSAAEANRGSSRLLRGVRAGRSYVVTAHGRPIARLVPVDDEADAELRLREVARQTLLERLEGQPVIDIGRWTRDEFHDL